VRHVDNLLKPDLIAPGNKIVGALANSGTPAKNGGTLANALIGSYPSLEITGFTPLGNGRLMQLSGTSIAAPAVSGAVALMLQANPGLTPPLIKAILQYTAQPIATASLVQQGAGLLNVEGAVRLAKSLRADIASAIAAGTIKRGGNLLAGTSACVIGLVDPGRAWAGWSGVTAGGSHLPSGPDCSSSSRASMIHGSFGRAVRFECITLVYWPNDTHVQRGRVERGRGHACDARRPVADAIAGATSYRAGTELPQWRRFDAVAGARLPAGPVL
jgi:hypothetical protein